MLDPVYQYLLRFVDLSREEFSHITQYAEIRHFNKKVRLINIGEEERYVNFVMKGLARKYFYRHREEVITQIAKEHELICSISFFSGAPSDYVVETIEPTTMVSISRDNLEKIYSMNFKMERLGRLVTTDWLLQKEHWENARIKLRPKDRFLNFINDQPDLLIRVPQKYLASYLNIKPETFSRYKRLLIPVPINWQPDSLKPVIQH